MGADGNVWFTETAVNKIGKITPYGAITEYPLPDRGVPLAIASGADGNLWVTMVHVPIIYRVSPSAEITAFHLHPDTVPGFITSGPDGNLWFAEPNGKIAKMTTDGQITEYIVARIDQH